MPPSRAEIKAYMESTRTHATMKDTSNTLLRSAAVSSEKLTGQPEWDLYLQKLQLVLNEAEADMEAWKDACVGNVEDAAIRDAQIQYHSNKGRADAIRWAMDLPSLILKEHHESRSL